MKGADQQNQYLCWARKAEMMNRQLGERLLDGMNESSCATSPTPLAPQPVHTHRVALYFCPEIEASRKHSLFAVQSPALGSFRKS